MERTMKRRVVTCDTVSSWAFLCLLRVRVGIVGRIGGVFRASWAIARPHWALVGAYCGVLETFRGHLGPSFGHLGPFGEGGGARGAYWAYWKGLAESQGVLGTVLGDVWAVMGQYRGPRGCSSGGRHGLVRRIGPSEGRQGANFKIYHCRLQGRDTRLESFGRGRQASIESAFSNQSVRSCRNPQRATSTRTFGKQPQMFRASQPSKRQHQHLDHCHRPHHRHR